MFETLNEIDTFLDRLAQAALLEPARLAGLRAQGHGFGTIDRLIQGLQQAGWLTAWQVDQLRAGRVDFSFGPFRLVAFLGAGEMGEVFRAVNQETGSTVALKILNPSLTANAEALGRFQREAAICIRLRHPNLVAAEGVAFIEHRQVLILEYVPGKTLKQYCAPLRTLPIGEACEVIRQAALGLEYAHQNNLVHRDVKPGNLMLTDAPRGSARGIKILDLGLAGFIQSETGARLTATGRIIGTPDYVAPEQARDSTRIDGRSDIFSLGCVLFELLTGQAPYKGKTLLARLLARLGEDAPPVRRLRLEVPAGLEAVLSRMLAREVGARLQSAGEVARQVAPFAQPIA